MMWHDDSNRDGIGLRLRRRHRFRVGSIPKLANLDRARRAGLPVPPTCWAWAGELAEAGFVSPPGPIRVPCIVRSGSPTEDTRETSNAGQFLSVVVHDEENLGRALREVVAALPAENGRPLGVVFVQPWIESARAGVTFFDGFYYEETSAEGGNAGLTSGVERGDVRRGQVERDDPHSAWLLRLHRAFGGTIDVEWAEPPGAGIAGRVILQVRPALFPVSRNETLSLANHKEILGDPPSPWMLGVMIDAGQTALEFFRPVVTDIHEWQERYAIEAGERAWMNFSALFRIMDRWGLPRSMVTQSVGGAVSSAADDQIDWPRFWWTLLRKGQIAACSYRTIFLMRSEASRLDRELAEARSLPELRALNARAMNLTIRTNLALMMILSVACRLRRYLGLAQTGRVVTHEMMDRYARLAALPELRDRHEALDEWLAEYGHRGPFETDPSRPRYRELRDLLRGDLTRSAAPPPPEAARPRLTIADRTLGRFLFLGDEWREWFRDRIMRWWDGLRIRILEEAGHAVDAGHLDTPGDVFFLRAEDLEADPSSWRARVAVRRQRWEAAARMNLPTTAKKDAIAALISHRDDQTQPAGVRRFSGIGLGRGAILGTAVRGSDPTPFLLGQPLPEDAVLVAATLEPSWGILFPRFKAVVADLGGELSHAAILLREAEIPSVVNARGAFAGIADGDRVRVDPERGEVVVEAAARTLTTAIVRPTGILNKAN